MLRANNANNVYVSTLARKIISLRYYASCTLLFLEAGHRVSGQEETLGLVPSVHGLT